MAVITPLFSQKTQSASGSRVIPSLFKTGTNTPVDKSKMTSFAPTPTVAPTVGPVQITPTQKKIDLNKLPGFDLSTSQVGTSAQVKPIVIKGLSFTPSTATNPKIEVPKEKSKVFNTIQKISDNLREGFPLVTAQIDAFTSGSYKKAPAPIQIKKTLTDVFIGAWKDFADSMKATTQINKKDNSFADAVSQGLRNVQTGVGVLFSPITALFAVSENLQPLIIGGKDVAPLIRGTMQAIQIPFMLAGEAEGTWGTKLIDALPLSEKDKATLRPEVTATFSLLGQIALGEALHIEGKKAKAVFNKVGKDAFIKLTKDTLTTYNLPKDISVNPEIAKNFYIGGKVIDPEVAQALKDLGLSNPERVQAMLNGLEIKIPLEKVVTVMDKPYWNKIKTLFKVTPTSETTIIGSSKAVKGVKGLLEPGDYTPQEVIGKVISGGIEKTPEGKQLVKLAVEAQGKGQGITVSTAPVPREVVKIDKTQYPGIESGMAIIRPDKTASLDVRFIKEAQGKGQGTKAVQELEQKLVDKGIKTVSIESLPEAVGFWQKQGYIPTGEIVPNQNVTMTKTLESPQITAKPKEGGGVVPQAQKETQPIIGEGRGVSKVGVSIEAQAIEKKLTKSFGDTAEYNKITIKEQARLVSDLINKDIERAKRIVLGQEKIPSKLRAGTMITAMEDYALKNGDVELLRQIAKSPLVAETSLHAQELRLLAERNPDSPVNMMKDIIKAREKAFEKKYNGRKVKDVVKNEVERIKKEVKKIDKYDWNDFIDGIETCK